MAPPGTKSARRSGRRAAKADTAAAGEILPNAAGAEEHVEERTTADGGQDIASDRLEGGNGSSQIEDNADRRLIAFFDKRYGAHLRDKRSKQLAAAKKPLKKSAAMLKIRASGSIPAVSPALAAVATASYNTPREGHQQVYRSLSLMANEAHNALINSDQDALEHYIKALQALGRVSVGAVENIGPHHHCGLNAMLTYISSSLFNCVMDPDTTVYNQATAQAMLEAAKAEVGGGRGGRGGRAPTQEDVDKDHERRDDRRDDRHDDRKDRRGRRFY